MPVNVARCVYMYICGYNDIYVQRRRKVSAYSSV